MWLTGFDAPCLHTMYVDKPMRGHGLMQAIARVNRVFRTSRAAWSSTTSAWPTSCKQALATYTESGGTGKTALDQDEAVAVMLEKYEICRGLFHGFDWSAWTTGTPQERLVAAAGRAGAHPRAGGRQGPAAAGGHRAVAGVRARGAARGGAARSATTSAFFQAVRAVLAKSAPGERRTDEELDHAIRQIISQGGGRPDEVVDIFAAAGLKKPDISILSDEFLAEVRGMPQRNLAVELLQKLLEGRDQDSRSGSNVVQARSFAEMLEQAMRTLPEPRHRDGAGDRGADRSWRRRCAQANARGEELGLTDDELAFYDALETNDSAVKVLGDDDAARPSPASWSRPCAANVTIDWTVRENVRAQLRVLVKRILRKYGYPPDKQEKATQTVLEQAELLSQGWAAA